MTLWDPSQENDGNHSSGGNFLVLIQEMMLYATVDPRYDAPGNDARGLIPEKMGLSARRWSINPKYCKIMEISFQLRYHFPLG